MTNEGSRDRKDLKIQALLEKISSLTANYENQVAELRIDLTLMSDENSAAKATIQNLLAEREAQNADVSEEANSDSSD